MLRVLHTSDLHGHYKALLALRTPFDVWVDTGDFFDNFGRKRTGRIEAEFERKFQARWLSLKQLPARLTAWLDGRPALIVPGNHDFVSLEKYLQRAGANAQRVDTAGVDLLGYRWAGFREIPYIDGEWAGEEHDLRPVCEAALAADPHILLTHGPPGGVLDSTQGYGSPALTALLTYSSHRVALHLFGHCHEDGGRIQETLGVRFVNGACRARVLEL